MKISQFVSVILLSALSLQSVAGSRVLELGHEAAPAMIRMPDSDTSELTLQVCATCKVLRLRASPTTRYMLGTEQITRAEMAKYLDRNPDASVVVMQLRDTFALKRVVVTLPLAAK